MNYFDLRWLLLIPAMLAISFLGWVYVRFSRDRARYRKRNTPFGSRRHDKSGLWE